MAISSNDPAVFFESQRLDDQVEFFRKDGLSQDYCQIPFGEPDVTREGGDVTV